jgi:hypothetical protein
MGLVTDFALSQRKECLAMPDSGRPLTEKAPQPLTAPIGSREIIKELI